MIEIGDFPPPLILPATGGRTLDLTQPGAAGGPLVLFFYPRDNTSGCTKEAIAFSALQARFQDAGAQVFGVSADSMASHDRFADRHGLTVPLASDPDHRLSEAFGFWKEKSMYGRRFWGIERSTVVIGADGRVARVWRKLRVPGHAEEVLAAVQELAAAPVGDSRQGSGADGQ